MMLAGAVEPLSAHIARFFYITDSSCCVVLSASNSHDSLKIDYCAVVNLNATLLVFILLIY